MNIVVAMKQIPDLQQIRIRNRQPLLDDVPLTFGNIDKNALEAGMQIKEANQGKVTVVCAGPRELADTVKEALAAGADEARLLIVEEEMDSAQSARLIAAALRQMEQVDLIIMGEGSGDNYSSQVGSRVAQILGIPQVGFASCIEVKGSVVRITRSLEDCEEIIEAQLPVLITVMSDINTARIPSVSQILRAGKKPVVSIEAQELGIDIGELSIETISNLAPEMQRRQIVTTSAAELVRALESEGFGGRG
ncbi:MAG TPA: electron transfer flavoprotein subunit beta/FixA family protein [Syntrophomonadaceae bacterium]|nr:electron transfer flavoprotein subunit beta/FixA family protein [Syntrophomonadaceae bacterium]